MDNENTPRIRNALNRQSSKSGALEFRYNQEKLKQENRYRVQGEAFPERLNQFNWGACILTPIWGLGNNTPIACLSIVLSFIPYVGIILALIFSIYCGIKGNEWAWQNKEWTDLKQFHEVQRKWAAAGVIIELVSIVIFTYAAFSIIDQINQFL